MKAEQVAKEAELENTEVRNVENEKEEEAEGAEDMMDDEDSCGEYWEGDELTFAADGTLVKSTPIVYTNAADRCMRSFA